MSTAWWMKASRRQKVPSRKVIRWELIGLEDPAVMSIEDIRREVLAASSSGLSLDTVARTQRKDAFRRSASEGIIEEAAKDLLKKSREKGR